MISLIWNLKNTQNKTKNLELTDTENRLVVNRLVVTRGGGFGGSKATNVSYKSPGISCVTWRL